MHWPGDWKLNDKPSAIKAIVTLIGVSVATVSGIVIPLAIWFHTIIRDMRLEDMQRLDQQFAKIDSVMQFNRSEDLVRAGRLAAIEKSIEMILSTRKENLEEINKRFDRIDITLLRLEAKIDKP